MDGGVLTRFFEWQKSVITEGFEMIFRIFQNYVTSSLTGAQTPRAA